MCRRCGQQSGYVFHFDDHPAVIVKCKFIKTSSPTSNNSIRSSGKQCWICFAVEDDDPSETWTNPCKCKGTTKWVHQRCLLMWIDLTAKGRGDEKILCPQCKMEYTIYYPPSNLLVSLLDVVDSAIFKFCPFMAGAILVLLLYWSSITYGVIVMIQQVLGPEATRDRLESTSPAVLLTALPALPILLLGFTFLRWEERLLLCLRKYGPRIPLLRHVLPAPVANSLGHMMAPQIGEEMTCTRLLVTSLLTPGLAAVIGNLLFKHSVESPIKRAFFGFLVMNIVHGVISMYHKQMIYKKYKGRRVMDYTQNDEPLQRPQIAENVPPS